jgi:hypothetical protein
MITAPRRFPPTFGYRTPSDAAHRGLFLLDLQLGCTAAREPTSFAP